MIPPRHVLMTADTIGGVWTYAMELARSFSRRRIQVSLATMGQPMSAAQRSQAAQIPDLAVYESAYKLEWMQDPWDDVDAAGQWLLDLEDRLGVDLVHLNGFAHGALDWRSPSVIVAHSCVLSWWEAVHGCSAPAEWDEYRRRVRAGLENVNAIAGVTEPMCGEIQRLYGSRLPVIPIHNGVRVRNYSPSRKEEMVLSCGRLWDAAKNMAALNNAAAQVHWPVYVAGETKHPGGGEASMERLACIGSLSSESLAGWYGRAAIFALPAKYEPFGLAPLEAALSGCALVLGDIPSLRDVWSDAAVFVAPDDHQALANVINDLISRKSFRDEMARRARMHALRYTSDRMAAAYLGLYSRARRIHEQSRETGASCAS